MIMAPFFAALLLVFTCRNLEHPFGSRGTMRYAREFNRRVDPVTELTNAEAQKQEIDNLK